MLNSNDSTASTLVASYVLIVKGEVVFNTVHLNNVAYTLTGDYLFNDLGDLIQSTNNIYNVGFDTHISLNINKLEDALKHTNIAIFGDAIIIKSYRTQGVA